MTMWKPLAVCAVAVLVLTGCSDAPAEEPVTETPESSEVEAAPLQSEAVEFTETDEKYLFEIRKRTDIEPIVSATNQELLEAGNMACEMLVENPYVFDLQLIDGETPRDDGSFFESAVIGTHAHLYLCPDVEIVHQKIG